MTFDKKEWKDARVEFPSRRSLYDVETGEIKIVRVAKEPGTIIQIGDEWNATNMNDLEKRISDGFSNVISEITEVAGDIQECLEEANTAAENAKDYRDAAIAASESAESASNVASQAASSASSSASIATEKANLASQMYEETVDKYNATIALANNAKSSAYDSEAYAIGKRNGVDVSSTDPAYHNNSKYYMEQATDPTKLALKQNVLFAKDDGNGNIEIIEITQDYIDALETKIQSIEDSLNANENDFIFAYNSSSNKYGYKAGEGGEFTAL